MAVIAREYVGSSACHTAQSAVRDFGWYIKKVAYGHRELHSYVRPVDTLVLGFLDRAFICRLRL